MAEMKATAIGDGPRRLTLQSTRLLHEWSEIQPWDETPVYELRLGPTALSANAPVLTPAIEAMLRNFNRYADLIGVRGDEIDVVEAKMVPEPGAISQLQHYIDLLPLSPWYQARPGKRVQGVLLFAVNDPVITQKAESAGIRVEIFTPTWAQQYLDVKYYRRRSP
jgi:hypothetical protein